MRRLEGKNAEEEGLHPYKTKRSCRHDLRRATEFPVSKLPPVKMHTLGLHRWHLQAWHLAKRTHPTQQPQMEPPARAVTAATKRPEAKVLLRAATTRNRQDQSRSPQRLSWAALRYKRTRNTEFPPYATALTSPSYYCLSWPAIGENAKRHVTRAPRARRREASGVGKAAVGLARAAEWWLARSAVRLGPVRVKCRRLPRGLALRGPRSPATTGAKWPSCTLTGTDEASRDFGAAAVRRGARARGRVVGKEEPCWGSGVAFPLSSRLFLLCVIGPSFCFLFTDYLLQEGLPTPP